MNTTLSAPLLEKELAHYSEIAAEYRAKYPRGWFIVIKWEEVLGVFESRHDALKMGIRQWGDIQFLVRSLDPIDNTSNYTRPLYA